MHSFFEHLFPLHGWPRTLHQKIVTYSRRLPSLIVESQKCMYSLEWHTLGMLHKNMRYEIVNCSTVTCDSVRVPQGFSSGFRGSEPEFASLQRSDGAGRMSLMQN